MAEARPLGDARLHRPARRPDRRARLAGGAAEEAPRRDRLPRRGRGRRADVRAAALRRAAARGAAASSAPSSSTAARPDEVRAAWLVLATGAQPQATLAAGLCERRTPSGIALRGYVRNPAMTPRITSLEVVWHKRLAPGYGWIFPVRRRPVQHRRRRRPETASSGARPGRAAMQHLNLREVFAAFQSLYAPARELVEGGEWQGAPGEALKGAPLRCSLEGARFEAPGVLVRGEAAGSTYALTGEGIGKAMETALHAAEAILGRAAPTRPPSAPTTAPGSPRCSRASTSTSRPTARSPIPGWSTCWSGARSAARAACSAWPACSRRPTCRRTRCRCAASCAGCSIAAEARY